MSYDHSHRGPIGHVLPAPPASVSHSAPPSKIEALLHKPAAVSAHKEAHAKPALNGPAADGGAIKDAAADK